MALVLALASHSASQGKSRFELDAQGTVSIDVQLSALDLPELCNVDLSVTTRRAEQEARLDTCVARGLPLWLRISADGAVCPLDVEGWRELEPATVPPVLALSARAVCQQGGAADLQALTIDWGFFRGTPLDHTSVARVIVPAQEARMFAFSKRAPKLTVPLTKPVSRVLVGVVAGIGVLTVVGAVLAGLFIARRRARG